MKLIDALRAMPAFSSLPADELHALSFAMAESAHPDGYVYLRQGDRADAVHLLLEGQVVVRRTNVPSPLATLAPGVFFGTVALVDDQPRTASCVGLGPTRAATLKGSGFALLFNAHASLALAFQEALAAQLALDFRNASARLFGSLESPVRVEE